MTHGGLSGGDDCLAYVFWHWPEPDHRGPGYERSQRTFHGDLGRWPPRGFIRSASYCVSGLPWTPPGDPAYEDWYLVDGFAELEELNRGAVSGRRRPSHDAAAARAAGGSGGLYRLVLGRRSPPATTATWFGKPRGVPYADFLEAVEESVDGSASAVWMRQMVLGPGFEFCIQSREETMPDLATGALTVPLRRVYPADD